MITSEELTKITKEHYTKTSYDLYKNYIERAMLQCANLGLSEITYSISYMRDDEKKALERELNNNGYITEINDKKQYITISWNEL